MPLTTKIKSPPSIYDVAKVAGVSAGTVSRVLNRRGSFSEGTRNLVLETARELQFRSRIATRKSTIALVTDKARYATFGGFLSCLHTNLTEELAKVDVSIQLFTEANLDRLSEHTIDGIISISWDASTIEQLRRLHENAGVPVLMFNHSDIPEFSCVESDYEGGGRMAAQCLWRHGHRRIACVAEAMTHGMTRRFKGMTDYLAGQGADLDESLIALTRHNRTEDAIRRVMARKPTAIFVASEDLVLETLSALREGLKVRVPEDISLAAMENVHINRFTSPPISSVRQPFEQMAVEAMSVMTQLMGGGNAEPVHRTLKNEWIDRLSVAHVKPDE